MPEPSPTPCLPDRVSVIIPAYNAAAYIARAIESALAQIPPPLEVIVVDDGSKDETREIVSRLPSPTRLFAKANGGPATARNAGAAAAKGNWLAFLDADDWWFPDKLRRQLAYAADPKVGLIHCLPDHRNERVPPELTFEHLWERNWIINSSVLIRRGTFEVLGGFNEAPELISVEDYNLWVRVAASQWRVVTCPTILVHYTRGIGISSNSGRFFQASLFNIEDLGNRLALPKDMLQRKRNDIIVAFGRRALYERDLPAARRLFRTAFQAERSGRNLLHIASAFIPESVLNLRRNTVRLLSRRADDTATPAEAASLLAPEFCTLDGNAPSSILDPNTHSPIGVPHPSRPMLITTIDAEEDFDWARPFSSAATDVTSMRSQHLAHRIMERYGVVPTYMVDYPVASQDEGRAPLRELLQSGACEIGAQLHPWVTPPIIEYISPRNSYHGNLPPALEFAKVRSLTQELEAAFGVRPGIFRAGRYGIGPNTGNILQHFGYEADSSVVPHWNFTTEGGPDFRSFTARPYWIGLSRSILELPVSAALVGKIATLPCEITSRVFSRSSERLRVPSVMAHLGLMERIKLTPEGIKIEEAKRLVRYMVDHGHKVFVLTYHSPSLEPGNTPYVRTKEDLARFLRWLDELYAYFTTEIGGVCARWRDVRSALQ